MISLAMVAIVVTGCAAPSSASSPLASPSAVPPPEVVCDTAQFQPPPSLTCGPALTAALAVLGPAHAPIIREEFRWGGLCPPGAPCAPPLGNAGIVIVDFANGSSVFVYVSAEAGGCRGGEFSRPLPVGLLTRHLGGLRPSQPRSRRGAQRADDPTSGSEGPLCRRAEAFRPLRP